MFANYAILFIGLLGVVWAVKKVSLKQKYQMLARSKKILRKKHKRNRTVKRNRAGTNGPVVASKNHIHGYHLVQAPTTLSIFDNPTETLAFFKKVNETILSMKYHEKLFFDLTGIESVTVDAIMYLIATIRNTRRIRSLELDCLGNVPRDEKARQVFETSGFYDHVSPQFSYRHSSSNNHINITRGKEADPALAGEICEFVHSHSNANRLDTKSLYTMVMELMTNTKQHAYTNNTIMNKNWYVFVEDMQTCMRFVFLDTGAGIPNTIRTKGFIEKIKNALNTDDAYFIASALRGEVRSETRLDYRGKGLPEVYNRASSKYINDFSIISGFGRCDISEDGEIIETKLGDELPGTMLCWKLVKK